MAKKHYIVCMRDDNMRLIGPFDTQDALSEWASYKENGSNPNNTSDDPRWQSIELDGDDRGWDMVRYPNCFGIPVFSPSDGPMPD